MKYFFFLIRHKWLVFLAGIFYTRANIFNLIIHDWSKFTPKEFPYYRLKHLKKTINQESMQAAWLNHQNKNPHHWEYWISRSGHGNEGIGTREIAIEMPMKYVREMVADWMGASRTYGTIEEQKEWPNVLDWYWMKKFGVKKMKGRMHPKTIEKIDIVFNEVCHIQNKIHCDTLFTRYLNLNDDDISTLFFQKKL